MTLAEFKAWLEGFEHSFDMVEGCAPPKYVPNGPQWEMIKAKLALVGTPIMSAVQPTPRQMPSDWYKAYITNQNADAQNIYRKEDAV
ncbi:hypothetical protein [Labrys neptuniae]